MSCFQPPQCSAARGIRRHQLCHKPSVRVDVHRPQPAAQTRKCLTASVRVPGTLPWGPASACTSDQATAALIYLPHGAAVDQLSWKMTRRS
ncbi:hypothetical protein NDU88_002791 [Pleurodeles waltl]|uniref:Uncharacterized protein n=1 Tax=Pleurodeles waltl TaxID=8319 RepID=A0AAV7NF05_PLEWA|nr:hypothetical protein NDU88_002791 [Pleurodeles waltl]